MEKQTKHRILGILVVIGLVVILLPLFQDGKGLTTEASLTQAPPFPDQPVQVAINTAEEENITSAQPVATPQATEQLDDVITATHPSVISANMPEASTDADTKSDLADKVASTLDTSITKPEAVKTSNFRIIEGEKAAAILKKSPRSAKRSRNLHSLAIANPRPASSPFEGNGLLKLKSAVWVIQVGSFKNKANALRVVNQLRANGYHAFIQEIVTAMGDNTRVYVGPENKHDSARMLASRLQSEMHLDGIVISYQPFAL